jgi:hypothetical protein
MSKSPHKTFLGLPHAVIRRILVFSVIGFPFVGSSLSPLIKSKKVAEVNCEKSGEPALRKIASLQSKADKIAEAKKSKSNCK